MSASSILITGATGGLGQFLAAHYAEEGLQVIALGRKPRAEAGLPGSVRYIEADLAGIRDFRPLADEIGACPDCQIHAAVSYPKASPFTGDINGLASVFEVNALAPAALATALLERRDEKGFASVILIGSEAMFSANSASAVYGASKAALRVLAKGLADAMRGQNVAVATFVLGPLANDNKRTELRGLAEKRGVSEAEITQLFLKKSNPNLVINDLISFDACRSSIDQIHALGPVANGMQCRLDGGSAGSLI